MSDTINLSFGVISKSLVVQLEEQGFKYKGKNNINKCKDAMNTLRFNDLLCDSDWHKMNKKLFNYIIKNIEKIE